MAAVTKATSNLSRMQTVRDALYGDVEHWSFATRPLLGNIYALTVPNRVTDSVTDAVPDSALPISVIEILQKGSKRTLKRKVDPSTAVTSAAPRPAPADGEVIVADDADESVVATGVLNEWITREQISAMVGVDPQLASVFSSMESDLFNFVPTEQDQRRHHPRLKMVRAWLNQKYFAFSPLVNGSGLLLTAFLQRMLCTNMPYGVVLQCVSTMMYRCSQLTLEIPVAQLPHFVPETIAQRTCITEYILHVLTGRSPRKGDAAPKWGDIKRLSILQPGCRAARFRADGLPQTKSSSGFAQMCRISDDFAIFAQSVLADAGVGIPADWAKGVYHSRAAAVKIVSVYARHNKLIRDGAIQWTPVLEKLFGPVPDNCIRSNRVQGLFKNHISRVLQPHIATSCIEDAPATSDTWTLDMPKEKAVVPPTSASSNVSNEPDVPPVDTPTQKTSTESVLDHADIIVDQSADSSVRE